MLATNQVLYYQALKNIPTTCKVSTGKVKKVKKYPFLDTIVVLQKKENKPHTGKQCTSVVTWNIDTGPKALFCDERIPLICQTLIELDADIILLQEVSKQAYALFYDRLSLTYNLCEFHGKKLGQVTFSKFEILTSRLFHFSEMKHCLITEIATDNKIYTIANVHLSSSRCLNCQDKRIEQLKYILEHVKDPVLLCGDFNLSEPNQCQAFEKINALSNYTDVWLHHKPNDPGYTLDIDRLCSASTVGENPPSRRFDKAWVKNMNAFDIEIICQQKYKIQEQLLCLSDHYALQFCFC